MVIDDPVWFGLTLSQVWLASAVGVYVQVWPASRFGVYVWGGCGVFGGGSVKLALFYYTQTGALCASSLGFV